MNHRPLSIAVVLALCASGLVSAAPVPLNLPRPDGQPGNPKKPVKVYILAGQSNMVGMGGVSGAQPPCNVFYSADPAIIPGTYQLSRPDDLKSLDTVSVFRHGFYGTEFDVPVTGSYRIRGGEVVQLEAGKRYPVPDPKKPFWLEQVNMPGKGDLVGVTKNDKKFTYLIDEAGNWTARNDVTYTDPRLFPERPALPLSPLANNGKTFGPELGFGWVVGTFHDEQVLLIKTAIGNRSLNWDFRPPSSGHTDKPGADKYEGYEYRAMLQGVRDTLKKYEAQGYEIAGFGWFQGHKDAGSTKEEYEKHLVNLINDLRKDLNAPKMKAVVATVGFHGYRLPAQWQGVWEAQMAVGDPKQHPEFAGNVASIDTRDFWREAEESPKNQDYHYNWNAETYMLVGETMGRAMVRLLGGEAEAIPKSDREARAAAEDAKPKPTAAQLAAHWAAMKPMLVEGALASFLRNPKNQTELQANLAGKVPAKRPELLDDTLDLVVAYYQAAGVHDYDWKPVGNVATAPWNYLAFDLPGSDRKTKAKAATGAEEDDDAEPAPAPKGKKAPVTPPPKIVLPAGAENWFAPEFDAKKAGWKSGVAPFGEVAPSDLPDFVKEWQKKRDRERPQPVTVTDGDVLLLRQTVDVPALKDGYRYRIRMAGSPHNNMGEGFGIYINGKLLLETRDGLTAWHREVFKSRGAFITADFRDEFKAGKVTIAVANYPLYGQAAEKFYAPGPALTVWLEEQKLPPVGQ